MIRVVHTYDPRYQPKTVLPRRVDAHGKALPHMIVSITGTMIKQARGGGEYEHPCTVQIDTSKWLAVVADETYSMSRCRVHADGLPSPVFVDKSMNFVLIELGFTPPHLDNGNPFIAY